MSKGFFKVLTVVALVASFFVPGGIFLSGGILGTSYLSISFAAVLQGVAAISASIGFAPEIDLGTARLLAENLSIQSDPVAIREVALGKTGRAGHIVFRENIENSGDTPDELLVILRLTGYPGTSLEKFWFNGELVFSGSSTTGPGAITTGKFANDLWVWFRTGEETTAAFPEIASLSTRWAAKTRTLRGCACIGIRVKVTEKLEGRLEPLAEFKGAKLYDPRLDSTVPGGSGTHDFDDPATWEWNDNPKCAEILYLRGGEVNGVRIFGMGKPKAAINLENMASEANICDEQIAVVGGGTINRYTCNGLLVPGDDHRQNLQKILSASASTMDASTGVYHSYAGAWRAPSMTLTEADIDGVPSEIRLQIDPSEEKNIISGVFADPADRWRVKEYPERRDETSIAQIGENAITLDLPFTIDHRMAQRIAKIEILRLNAAKGMNANYWLNALPLQPGDIVTQQYARYQIDHTFRVHMWGLQGVDDKDGKRRLVVPMQLIEELQEWFTWNAATEEKSSAALDSLPSLNRNPKMITLEGSTAFEGALPPANPKVGWLWRDTDTNITFRWNGAAWVDFATETKTADQVNYLGGATVESLEPAEAAADVTENNASNIIFYQSAAPASPQEGWIWVDTDDSRIYRRVGAAWQQISALNALLLTNAPAEAGADVTANNADTIIFSQAAAPASPQLNWLWRDTDDNVVRRWDGASWVFYADTLEGVGLLREGSSAGDGSTYRSVARGVGVGTATDGQVITFDPAWTNVPVVRFMSGGLAYNSSLTGDQTVDYSALNVSGSGFTARLKTKELTGAITNHTDSTVSTPSSPSGLDHSINKSQTAEAHDDKYTFQYDVTLFDPPSEPPEPLTVGFYTNDGSGWVQRATKVHNSDAVNATFEVTVDGLGLNDDFGINKESALGGSVSFDNVKYGTAAAPVTESATPTGASPVEYLVLGG